jgi:hypothetical protein
MTDQRLSNIRKRSGFEKFYTILKFFGGGLVFLISFVGEFGSSTNISFRYMMSNPKFPNIKHPETIGKFFELFAVSDTFSLHGPGWSTELSKIMLTKSRRRLGLC